MDSALKLSWCFNHPIVYFNFHKWVLNTDFTAQFKSLTKDCGLFKLSWCFNHCQTADVERTSTFLMALYDDRTWFPSNVPTHFLCHAFFPKWSLSHSMETRPHGPWLYTQYKHINPLYTIFSLANHPNRWIDRKGRNKNLAWLNHRHVLVYFTGIWLQPADATN